jgi:peptide/nickel transport system substrate-binding protein
VVLLGFAVAAAGCGSTVGAAESTTTTSNPADPWVPGVGGTITVGIDRAPTGCNPNSATGDTWADQLVLEPVLPSAFVVNPGGTSTYDSAVITQAEVVSTTPQTVVYTINPQAVWSDGVHISAADFIYAWRQQRGPSADVAGSGGDIASTLGYREIESVKGSNHGRTVTVVFKTHFADWQMLFNDLLPAHVMEKVGWDTGCSTVEPTVDLSGGPYEIGKVVAGREVVLVRNPRWWGQTPYLDQIVVLIGKSSSQLSGWVKDGKAQVALPAAFDASFLEQVSGRPSLESTDEISSTFLQLEYSTTSAVTGDLGVREALSHAVDRQALVNSVVGWADTTIVPAASHLYSQSQASYPEPRTPSTQVTGAPGYTPPSTSSTPTAAQPFPLTADLTETDRELEAAGYFPGVAGTWTGPDGKPLVVRVAIDTGDRWAVEAGTVLAHQLDQAGISVTLVTAPDAVTAGEDLASGAADAAVLPFEATPYPSEAIAWYTTLLGTPGEGGSQDWSNFDDATLSSILTKASEQLNPVDASPLYAEADALLWSQMVALPLFAEPTALVWSAFTSGVGPNPNGAGLLWLPQTWGLRVPATSPDTVPS